MWKEIIICIIIVTTIAIGNNITQNYSVESIETLTSKLGELKVEMKEKKENIDNAKIKEKANNIFNEWTQRYDKLAYYIEHDELEKVETNLTSLKSCIETNSFSEAVDELDKCTFVIKHIKDKYMFNLQNIF